MLQQRNLDILEDKLYRVSDPKSSEYGKHLSFDEVHALTAPDPEGVRRVLDWLHEFHCDDRMEHHPHYGMIRTVVPIWKAEKLLEAEYHNMRHASGTIVARTQNYSVPETVAPFVKVVGPTVTFPSLRTPRITVPAAPEAVTTPSVIRSNYGLGNIVGISPQSYQICTGFLKQYVSLADLSQFWSEYYKSAVGQVVNIVGPNGPNPGVEANLDIQYLTSIGGNMTTEFWSFNGTAPDNPANEPFLNFLYQLGNDTTPPWVASTSYGEDEDSVSMDYATSCNTEFQKNGARGISILFASGDSGVGADSGSCAQFVPQWPAASPYLTSVGASTTIITQAAGFSSGGFSNRWDQPSWQTTAVNTYLTTTANLPDASRFNKSGRAFPDIALVGEQYQIIVDKATLSVAGTSCSTPSTAGIVSLLNDIRFQAKKAPLGFLNPWLYSTAATCANCFYDVTTGSNPGCGTQGFPATKGWDPVTGWGALSYQQLAPLVQQLP